MTSAPKQFPTERNPLLASEPAAPVASPVGRRPGGVLPPVRGADGRSWVPKERLDWPTGPHAHAGGEGPSLGRPQGRLGRRQLAAVSKGLSERDICVLQRIAEHRFLTTTQLQGFVFGGHASEATAARTTRRTLARLKRDLLIRDLPRRQGGPLAGSTPAVWQLITGGARLLGDKRGATYRASVPTSRFLSHCLAVADTHLAILKLDRSAKVQVEGAATRSFSGAGGERQACRPDLFVSLTGEDELGTYEDAWFVEVDLGTESLPTLLKKCVQYERYRATGIEQAASGSFPLVMWLMDRTERVAALKRRIRLSPQLTPALYRFTTLEEGAIRSALTGDAS